MYIIEIIKSITEGHHTHGKYPFPTSPNVHTYILLRKKIAPNIPMRRKHDNTPIKKERNLFIYAQYENSTT